MLLSETLLLLSLIIIAFLIILLLVLRNRWNTIIDQLIVDTRQLHHALEQGALNERINIDVYHGKYAILAKIINDTVTPSIDVIKEATNQLDNLSTGCFGDQITTDMSGDYWVLRQCINQISKSLLAYEQMLEQQTWIRDSDVYFMEKLINLDNTDQDHLKTALSIIISDTVAEGAAIYLYDDRDLLVLQAVNSSLDRITFNPVISIDNNIIEQVARTKLPMMLSHAVFSKLSLNAEVSSYNQSLNTYVLPLIFNGSLIGIMELVFNRVLDHVQRHYIDHIMDTMSSYIYLTQQMLVKKQLFSEQEEMVSSVIDVMTKVNQGQWEERINKDVSHKQLLELQTVINESINSLQNTNTIALHQERLTTIGNMAASMAHEINNPISGIMMNLEYLNSLSSDDESHTIMKSSLQELMRISRLVNAMLSFSRKSERKSHFRECTLACVMDECLVIVHPSIKTGRCTFEHNTSQTNLTDYIMLADPDEIKQVLINLITNALQAMENIPFDTKQLSIDYSFIKEKQQILVGISDTGSGISADIKEKIFDPFFTTKVQGKGTGLGLSISSKLVHDFGGALLLDEDYKQGARFLLYLPAKNCKN